MNEITPEQIRKEHDQDGRKYLMDKDTEAFEDEYAKKIRYLKFQSAIVNAIDDAYDGEDMTYAEILHVLQELIDSMSCEQ